MSDKIVGSIPDFTPDGVGTVDNRLIEDVQEETLVEKDTPAAPPESETETSEQLVQESGQKPVENNTFNDDTKELKQIQGLENERDRLLREIQALRGTRRELKEQEIVEVNKKIETITDGLEGVNPEDISLIDRVIRSKGYITKEEAHRMSYDAVKNEEVNKFLEKYPEYKPENDPTDLNWSALQRQVQSWYRMPSDPRQVGELLLKAHRDISKVPSDRGAIEVKKQQVKIASSGSSGTQRSPTKPVNEHLSSLLRTHTHGWSEEEIKELEKKLPE